MRKIGTFFLGFLPVLFAFCAQFLALGLMFSTAAIFVVIQAIRSGDTASALSVLSSLFADTDFQTCMMLVYSIFCIVFCGLWYYRSCGGVFLPSVKKICRPSLLFGILFLVPGMQFAASCIIGVVSQTVPQWMQQYEDLIESAGMSSEISTWMLCYSVLLAPIGEELIFRGVTMRIFRRIFPFWAANLLQAALFGCFHLNSIQGIYAFTLGLILGYVCEAGGSIYLSILLHILFNFWGTVLSPLEAELISTPLALILYAFFSLISLFLGLALFYHGVKKNRTAVNHAGSVPAESV